MPQQITGRKEQYVPIGCFNLQIYIYMVWKRAQSQLVIKNNSPHENTGIFPVVEVSIFKCNL